MQKWRLKLLFHETLGWETGSQGASLRGEDQARMQACDLWLVARECQDLGLVGP